MEQRHNIAARGFAAVQRRLIGRTALINAAWKGDIGRVKALLDLNVDTEIKDKEGATALHWATYGGHKDVVALLLDRGADVAASDIVTLLLDNSADVAATDKNGWTALHGAARRGRKDVIALLLDKGADVAATDKDGKMAWHLAAPWWHDVVELLERALKEKKERSRITIAGNANDDH